jgi:signal transduction histidine kinase
LKRHGTTTLKVVSILSVTAVTLGVHYGWLLEPVFGDAHWVHAIHGRLCYIPIVMAASWFGLRGGLLTAAGISLLVLPYAFLSVTGAHDFVGEIAEIIFYFAIAILVGLLFDREFRARRKQQEAQLRAERSHQLSIVGQIAAGVAHEIKNPLASIKGATDILTDDDTTPGDRDEFSEILRNEVRRIDGTVTEFLAFARPKETRLARLDLSDAIRTSLRQIDSHAAARGITVERNVQDDVVIDGDSEKLHQLTLNLLLNAIQASGEGATVSVGLEKSTRSRAVLTVADTGAGIDRAVMDRVFDPFFTTKPEGTGLGLAVVREIVTGHNGTVSVESEKNRGTAVTVEIPLYAEKQK